MTNSIQIGKDLLWQSGGRNNFPAHLSYEVHSPSDAYLLFPGIDGDVTRQGFEKCVLIERFHFGASKHVESANGHSSNRCSSAAQLNGITLEVGLDSSSFMLWSGMINANATDKVTIYFAYSETNSSSGGGTAAAQSFRSFTLNNVMLTKFEFDQVAKQTKKNGVIALSKKFSVLLHLHFDNIEFEHKIYGPNGKESGKTSTVFDAATAT